MSVGDDGRGTDTRIVSVTGVPVTDLDPVEADGTTGTLVHFKPDPSLGSTPLPVGRDLSRLSTAWPQLEVQVDDRRVGSG